MLPGMNPKKMQKLMSKMGIKQEEIDAHQVIIRCEDKDIIVSNPHVVKVNAMGQETLQIVGDMTEVPISKISGEDIKTVMEQAGVDEETAREALEEHEGNLAEAILSLKES